MSQHDASGVLYDGTIALTTAAVPIATPQAVSVVLVQADPANATNVLIGNSSSQSLILTPGSGEVLSVMNLALVYARMASSTGTLIYHALS